MTDLNMKPKAQPETFEPEEIAAAVLALLIWVPMAVVLGALL